MLVLVLAVVYLYLSYHLARQLLYSWQTVPGYSSSSSSTP